MSLSVDDKTRENAEWPLITWGTSAYGQRRFVAVAHEKNLAASIFVLLVLLGIQNLGGLPNGNLSIINNDLTSANDQAADNRHWSVGTCPLSLLFSFIPVGGVIQPIYGAAGEYRVDPKNSIVFGLCAFKLAGVFSDFFLSTPYPGCIWVYSVGIGYARHVWKGLYIDVDFSPQYVTYYDSGGTYLANGFQLYLQAHLGYRFDFFIGKLPLYSKIFLEANYLAYVYDSNAPQSFQDINRKGNPFTFIPIPAIELGFRF